MCEEVEVVFVYCSNVDGWLEYCGYIFGNDLMDIGCFKWYLGYFVYVKLCDVVVFSWFYIVLLL